MRPPRGDGAGRAVRDERMRGRSSAGSPLLAPEGRTGSPGEQGRDEHFCVKIGFMGRNYPERYPVLKARAKPALALEKPRLGSSILLPGCAGGTL